MLQSSSNSIMTHHYQRSAIIGAETGQRFEYVYFRTDSGSADLTNDAKDKENRTTGAIPQWGEISVEGEDRRRSRIRTRTYGSEGRRKRIYLMRFL